MFNPFAGYPVTDDWDAHVARNAYGGGIDWGMDVGTPLPLAEDAKVEFIPYYGTGGHTVKMTYADGSSDFYMHCSFFIPGDLYRKAGQTVALSGGAKGADGAGNSIGPHLHAHGYNTAGVRVPPFHGVTTAGLPVTPFDNTPEEETDMRLIHQVFTNGAQAYVVSYPFADIIVNGDDWAAIKKATGIVPRQVNEYDWEAYSRNKAIAEKAQLEAIAKFTK